jgi:crotonobetainyl-CoA:carnitine CoA-transferase CaiB-like acyl-CoA transferase
MVRQGPLHGVRVLDVTRSIAGPWITRMLCDAGAEVLKIEPPPSGDFIRQLPISFGPFMSGYFIQANGGKKSLCIDLQTEPGRTVLVDLARHCDVVVQNLRPLAAQRLGLTYTALRQVRPDVIFCSVSGYGVERTPYLTKPGQDIGVQCMTGVAALSGLQHGRTSLAIWSLADTMTSVQAYSAICAAVLARAEGAGGCFVDMAMTDCTLQFHDAGPRVLRDCHLPVPIERFGRFHPFLLVRGVLVATDGYLGLSAYRRSDWARLAQLLGEPYSAPSFLDPRVRLRHREQIVARLDDVCEGRSRNDLNELFAAYGVRLVEIRGDLRDVARDERFLMRRSLAPVPAVGGCPTGVLGNSVLHPDSSAENLRRGAPLLGEHTGAILSDYLGYTNERIFQLFVDNVLAFDPDVLGRFVAEYGPEA